MRVPGAVLLAGLLAIMVVTFGLDRRWAWPIASGFSLVATLLWIRFCIRPNRDDQPPSA